MDKDTARAYLTDPKGRKPSEIGEAVAVLRSDYHSYKEMARDYPMSGKTLSGRHRIFRLPKGIRWKIDEGEISITKGEQIIRLNDEMDQWFLAFAIVEEQLEEEVCINVVTRVQKYNDSIRDALREAAGVQCDSIVHLMLPLNFDIRFAMAQKAWDRNKELQDFCYDQMREDPDAALQELKDAYRSLLSKFDEGMSHLLDTGSGSA